MKLVENDVDIPLKLVDTITLHLPKDKYQVRIFSDEPEKRWFAIRGIREGTPSFCFEGKFRPEVVNQAQSALETYDKHRRNNKGNKKL